MRGARALQGYTTFALGLVFVACQSAAPKPSEPSPESVRVSADRRFDASRAWHHLVELSEIGPRPSGSRGARRARGYLADQLERSGMEVEEMHLSLVPGLEGTSGDSRELVHLQVEIPGPSDDLVLLVARYDTTDLEGVDFVGANSGASGPALLLELARAIQDAALPYTHRIVFVDGDAIANAEGVPMLFGSRGLAESLTRTGDVDRLRLAVFFDQVGDSNLEMARDLRSHRVYREVFWDSALALGLQSAFSPDAGLESPVASHRAFLDVGLRQVVVLVDTHYGDGDAPGRLWHTADDTPDHCSQESLSAAGRVTLAGLIQIERRLAQIDRFTRSPIDFEPDPDPVRPPEPSAAAGNAPDGAATTGSGPTPASARP